jgi:hypothetical protein
MPGGNVDFNNLLSHAKCRVASQAREIALACE